MNRVFAAGFVPSFGHGPGVSDRPTGRPSASCLRRPCEYSGSSDWESGSNSGRRRVEIEFIIHPGGRVEEVVRGAVGEECKVLTKPFEEILGKVVAEETTDDYYKVKQNVDVKNTTNASGDGMQSW